MKQMSGAGPVIDSFFLIYLVNEIMVINFPLHIILYFPHFFRTPIAFYRYTN